MHKKYTLILGSFIAIVIVVVIVLVFIPQYLYIQSPAAPEGSPPPSLSKTALTLTERLNSTSPLLHEPVGGFRGPQTWISSPDNVTFDYAFYSRDYGPGNVTLTVYEVSNPLNATPVTPSPGISARMIPDRFVAFPETETISQLVVNISPIGYSPEPATRTFYVHAGVEGENNAIADDWIRVQMGDRPTTYQSYITTGDISGHNIIIHRGGQWTGNITVRPGERGTGPVQVWVKELDCGTMFFSSLDTPQPSKPGSPEFSIDPAQFIGRSYGDYELPVVISVASEVQLGTYCYELVINAPDQSIDFSTTVQVIP
ncbi:MAG: hypothetical protein WAK75_06650 [Methanoregula sp.]|uniref:hypothetical protein n=1 Tax=Methanoregula sp. TaxID=2052170 RepID=UPI003BAEF9A7